MKFTTHLFTPNNTGAPDYDICGQVASILDFTNTTLKVSISDGTTTQQLINTSDLSAILAVATGLYTFGSLDINVLGGSRDAVTGSMSLDMDFLLTGTSDYCTWKKAFLTIEVSKAGYQTYTNVIQIYGYDIGNDVTLGYSGNTDFDIYLVNNTDNLDIFGKQTKAFSKFAVLRQPFTDNVYFYNLVGTQGTITYKDTSTGNTIGTGSYGTVCVTPDNCGNNDIDIEQTIQVFSVDCVLLDTCSSSITSPTTIWLPKVTSTSTCPDACNDCINDISEVTVSTTVDYTLVTPFNVNNTLTFLSEFMDENTIFTLKDFSGIELDSVTIPYIIDYASWIVDSAPFLIPITYVITTPPLGDVTVTIVHKFSADTDLIVCNDVIEFSVCHWWNVTKGEKCGDYLFNNCSLEDISIVLQKFNSDRTFTDISTIVVPASSTVTISLQADGLYMLKVPSRDEVGVFEYYSIPSFCNIEACWLNFLNTVICNKPTDDCKTEDAYKFNAFLINAHTFFMMLNEEMNMSFIYTAIDDERLNNLYTLDSFITRFTEYCNPSDSACLPCSAK